MKGASFFMLAFTFGMAASRFDTRKALVLDEANAIGRRVEEILLANPAVKNTDRRQGRAELDEHAQGVNAAEIDVTLRDDIDKEAVLEALRSRQITGREFLFEELDGVLTEDDLVALNRWLDRDAPGFEYERFGGEPRHRPGQS